jgi:predicted RNase H-like nuclease (RuvC/YqgF family)
VAEARSQLAARDLQERDRLDAARRQWEVEKEALQARAEQILQQFVVERYQRDQADRNLALIRDEWDDLRRELEDRRQERDQLAARLEELDASPVMRNGQPTAVASPARAPH